MPNVYDLLKEWQIARGDEATPRTHRGLPPTPGKWHVPPREMPSFMKALAKCDAHCIAEVLEADAVSNLVFDVDLNLPVPEANLRPTIMAFCRTVRDVLREHTDVYAADRETPSEMHVLCKPRATDKPEHWKHGFKVMLPLDVDTPNNNRSVADAVRSRIGTWCALPDDMRPLNEPEDIVDDHVYTVRTWVMYGGKKAEQSEPYTVSLVLRGEGLDRAQPPDDPATMLSRHIIPEQARNVSFTTPLPSRPRGTKRRMPTPTGRPAPQLADLARLDRMILAAPDSAPHDTRSWLAMGHALRTGQIVPKEGEELSAECAEHNASLVDMWHNFSARSDKYDEGECQRRWDEFALPGRPEYSGQYPEYTIAVVVLVCKWRATADTDFDDRFMRMVYETYMKPSAENLEEAIREYRQTPVYQVPEDPDQRQRHLDAWRIVVDEILRKVTEDGRIRLALLKYMQPFFVQVTSASKTEIAQLMFKERQTPAGPRHVMCGLMRRLKPQWLDTYAHLADLMHAWLKWGDRITASGYTNSPDYVHAKDDMNLEGLGMPQANSFCGLAVDDVISPEEAREFAYDPAIVERVRDHIRLLVNNDPALLEFVERWIAAPLQIRGLLTGIMVINRSDQKGVGKGLFWNEFIGGRIYGRKQRRNPHFRPAFMQVKDIDHVVGTFNECLLGPVFLNLDECGIFDGATKQNEKLKSQVTEPLCTVNQKHMSLVEFENCINMILTSNKTNPIKIEHGDRRFLEIVTLEKRPKDYFKGENALSNFLLHRPETVKHFYSYLMQLEMGDFALIDPPMTADKAATIQRNLSPDVKFMQALCMRLKVAATPPPGSRESDAPARICDEEFYVAPSLLSTAFEQYIFRTRTEATREDLFGTLSKHLTTQTKSRAKVVYFAKLKSERAVVLPSLTEMERQLREVNLWSDDFHSDMRPPPMNTNPNAEETPSLYWGYGVKVIQ